MSFLNKTLLLEHPVLTVCHIKHNILCSHSFAYMYNLCEIVIDKPIGLGGIIYIHANIHVIYICTIIQFICILESQVVECSMGSFYTQRF